MNEELKPCPFCGCHAVNVMTSKNKTPLRHTFKCEDCPGMMDFYSSTLDQAITAWNRRADAPTIKDSLTVQAQPVAMTDSEIIALATRHANGDWNCKARDGYIAAVKALAEDVLSTFAPVAAQASEPVAARAIAARIISDYMEHYDFPAGGESHMHDCIMDALDLHSLFPAPKPSAEAVRNADQGLTDEVRDLLMDACNALDATPFDQGRANICNRIEAVLDQHRALKSQPATGEQGESK